MSFSKVSKKTLHHVACYRGKLTDVTLYRKSSLNLTKRWTGTEIKDVGDRVDDDVRSIQISLGVCATPMTVKVVRFQPVEGDVVAQYWTVREGEQGNEITKKKDLKPYCLEDIWATAAFFEKYIIDNAIPTIIRVHTPHRMLQETFVANDVVGRTYIMAVKYYYHLDGESQSPAGKTANPQKKLLGSLFVLWLAISHTTGSFYICGDDKLGMEPEVNDSTYPLFGRVATPPMLDAQLDSINQHKVLSKYSRKVLRELEKCIYRNQSSYWWTIYICTFILLHQASCVTADRYRHARNEYGAKYRHFMSELTSEQHDLVMQTLTDSRIQNQLAIWKRYKEQNGMIERQPLSSPLQPHEAPYMGSQALLDWDHPCYWIAQMFEERWQAHPTYKQEFAG
ncbi:hypothetical protein E4U42_006603 [Claviceps africana]|uniref:Uncharacterized protein n=1 Tax=Claviceps africana TaxID=83212 RepID=A0A8K0NGP2_9HYPO|nr:hypothetical protein E4U42_006603 [Claviceps africana]